MRIIVLGAGLLGVTSAYYLSREGHELVVVDRQPEPARETSFATACLLTPGHSFAWASPRAPLILLSSFWAHDPALKLRPRFSRQLLDWCWKFLGQCSWDRFNANSLAKMRLARFSLGEINCLTQEHGFSWDQRRQGVLYLHRDKSHMAQAEKDNVLFQEQGVELRSLTIEEIVALEPALAPSRDKFVGGMLGQQDESGDGRKFAVALGEVCKSQGVQFKFDTPIDGLVVEADRIEGVRTPSGVIQGDAYILALGSYSPLIAKDVGLSLPIYPVKGYSITLPVLDPAKAPSLGGVDDGTLVAYSRLGDRVRMTTMAEFAGYDTSHGPRDFTKLLAVARELFAGGVDLSAAQYWACLRPATPDGPPIIGATAFKNLWLNTGHGYLGWTMSCGSSRMLADLISGRKPELDPAPYRLSRY